MLRGRDGERERIAAVLAGGGALVVRGPGGTGKSALLAEAGGPHVLRVAGAPSESEMPFAALEALLRGLPVTGTLARALRAQPLDPRERMAASLELLAVLEAQAP